MAYAKSLLPIVLATLISWPSIATAQGTPTTKELAYLQRIDLTALAHQREKRLAMRWLVVEIVRVTPAQGCSVPARGGRLVECSGTRVSAT